MPSKNKCSIVNVAAHIDWIDYEVRHLGSKLRVSKSWSNCGGPYNNDGILYSIETSDYNFVLELEKIMTAAGYTCKSVFEEGNGHYIDIIYPT